MPLNISDLVEVRGITVVQDFLKGTKNHYSAAKRLFNTPCKNIFLMQRSSSIILNAEHGWDEENEVLQRIKKASNECEFFYHIVTLEGIEAHLQRENSKFPNFKHYSDNVEDHDGLVAIKTENEGNSKRFYLKKLPINGQDDLFKLNRQSRVLIIEDMENNVKAVVVQNLGAAQTCFVISGPKVRKYLEACIDYYNECEFVKWSEIVELHNKYDNNIVEPIFAG